MPRPHLNVAPCREFEFPAERLNLGILLGSGAFGRVLKAEASGIVSWEAATTVAVKMVKPQADISYIKVIIEILSTKLQNVRQCQCNVQCLL